MHRLQALLFPLAFFCHAAVAQHTVDAWLDTNRVYIGDQVNWFLKVQMPPGETVKMRYLPDSLAGVDVIQQFNFDTLDNQTEMVLVKRVIITAFDSGYYKLPPIPFLFFKPGGDTTRITSPSVELFVTNPPPVEDLVDIKDIIREKITFNDALPFIGLGLLFLLIVYLISRFIAHKKKAPPKIPPPPIPFPVQILNRLQALREQGLWQKGDIKSYESELTLIVREYLKVRYQVPALETTTNELLQLLTEKQFPTHLLPELKDILQIADLVKFAKATPPGDILEKAMDDAIRVVKTTAESVR